MSKNLMLAGAGVAAVVLVGLAAMMFLRSGGAAGDDMRYLPNKCAVIGSVKMSEVVQSQAYKDLMAEAGKLTGGKGSPTEEMEQGTGVAVSDITRMTFGASDNNKDSSFVLTTSKAVTAADLAGKMKKKTFKISDKGEFKQEEQARKFKEVKVGNFTMHQEEEEAGPFGAPPSPSAFCVVDKNTIVYSKADTLKGILERDKKTDLSDGMKAALAEANQSRPIFVAVNLKGMVEGAPKGRSPLNEFGPVAGQAAKVNVVAVDAALAKDAKLNVVAVCQDNATADEIRKAVEGGLVMAKTMIPNMPKELTSAIDSVKVAASGNKVTGTGSVEPAMLMSAVGFMGAPAKSEFKVVGKAIEDVNIDPPPKK